MMRPFLLRRKKSDPATAPELSPKIETDRIVPLSAEQVTHYEAVVQETMALIEASDGIERAGLVFKLLTFPITNTPYAALSPSTRTIPHRRWRMPTTPAATV